MQSNYLLEMNHISKSFPGVRALDDVTIQIEAQKVVALMGANGAGKSTLMKILSGAYSRDEGDIIIDGKHIPKEYKPIDARKHGIGIIYQELSLLPELSVAENIYITHEPLLFPGFVNDRKMEEMAAAQLEKLNAKHIDVRTKVGRLPLPEQQMVEIAKALALQCKIIIMDEPTTSLTWEETERLFDMIRALKKQGIAIIYISHRMDEIFKIADEAIIMKDGKVTGDLKIEQTDREQLIYLMTGRKIQALEKTQADLHADRKAVLELRNMSDGALIRDVSLKVYENEILGIGGLVGSKRTELFRMVCGIDRCKSGEIAIHGKKAAIKTPADAIRHGIGYLSENRKDEGLNLGLTIKENIALTDMGKVAKLGFINQKNLNDTAEMYIEKINVKGARDNLVMNLSGGNQQKVAIAKWLHVHCDILVFDEPTRGIDVVAKSEIYQLIRDFATEGRAAIIISSEVEELSEVCDRVIVMSKGEITHELHAGQINTDSILQCITTKEGA